MLLRLKAGSQYDDNPLFHSVVIVMSYCELQKQTKIMMDDNRIETIYILS